MKNHALFSSKDKSKKLKCRLLQFLFEALRVKTKLTARLAITAEAPLFLMAFQLMSRSTSPSLTPWVKE